MGITREGKKWRVRYSQDGVRFNVGSFKTKNEAQMALNHHKLHQDIGLESSKEMEMEEMDDFPTINENEEFSDGFSKKSPIKLWDQRATQKQIKEIQGYKYGGSKWQKLKRRFKRM